MTDMATSEDAVCECQNFVVGDEGCCAICGEVRTCEHDHELGFCGQCCTECGGGIRLDYEGDRCLVCGMQGEKKR